jgi:ferrous-iron efflux pump FieF
MEAVEGGEAQLLRGWATSASIGVAATLILAKLAAYWLTDSVSLLSSLIDSSTDLMASVVAFVGVRHAARPADRNHRFGHGKAEAVAALAQAMFIAGSAVLLGVEAARRLRSPEAIDSGAIAIGVMVLSIVLTAGLIALQRHVVRATGSIAVGADKLHYSGDLAMNAAVIAAIVLTEWTGIAVLDPLFGLGIAAFLVRGSVAILREALDVLMDRELPPEERALIEAAVLGHDGVEGLHDLRTRRSGTADFIEFHMEVAPAMTVAEAHAIADDVERVLTGLLPKAEILIHQEPQGVIDDRLDRRLGDGEPVSPQEAGGRG